MQFEDYRKHISQEKEHFIIKFLRGAGTQDPGIGKAKITETSNKFEYLLNANCSHAITYYRQILFCITKV